jgi:hypothetical protein
LDEEQVALRSAVTGPRASAAALAPLDRKIAALHLDILRLEASCDALPSRLAHKLG